MASLLEKYKWIKYLLGAFIVGLGVAIIILALVNTGQLPAVINIVLAVGLILLGGTILVLNIFTETHKIFTISSLVASGLITLGIVLLITRFHLHIMLDASFIVYLTAILSLVIGTYSLFKAISLIVYREKPILIAIMFVLAIVGITLGILALCFVSKLVAIAYVTLGIALVILGTISIIYIAVNKDK